MTYNIQGGLGTRKKTDFIEKTLLEEEPTILTVIESNIMKHESVPNILPNKYMIYAHNKKRLVSFIKRGSGFHPKTLDYDLDIPCHVINGRELTYVALYSQYKKYDDNDQVIQEKVLDPERTKILINAIKHLAMNSLRKLILMGDMNLDWRNETIYLDNYKKCLNVLGLTQNIKNITHPRNGRMKAGTTIDHVITKNLKGISYVHPMGPGDHHAVAYDEPGYSRIHNKPLKQIRITEYNQDSYHYARDFFPFADKNYDYSDIEKASDDLEAYMLAVKDVATKTITMKEGGVPWWKPSLLPLRKAMIENPDCYETKKKYAKALEKCHREYDSKLREKEMHGYRKKKRYQLPS